MTKHKKQEPGTEKAEGQAENDTEKQNVPEQESKKDPNQAQLKELTDTLQHLQAEFEN